MNGLPQPALSALTALTGYSITTIGHAETWRLGSNDPSIMTTG